MLGVIFGPNNVSAYCLGFILLIGLTIGLDGLLIIDSKLL